MTASDQSLPALREVGFAATDDLLRDDVRRLGAMVGRMLAEQGSQRLLDEVETVRRASIERREAGWPVDMLADALAAIPTDDADALVRAFAAYFGAINLAERVHRIRRRRDYQRASAAPQPGGLEAVLRELRDEGVGPGELQACLARLHVEPVFTAHPTEAVRRVLLEKERTIVERLMADIDRERTPTERRADDARIVLALTSAWQTSESPARKPTVGDEVDHVGYYLSNVLYRVLPVFYEALGDAIENVYGVRPELPQVLRFGTWVGGDMDGNPNVNAGTMRAALGAQRSQALAQYRSDLRGLGNVLTQTLDRAEIDEAVVARVDDYLRTLPGADTVLNPRHADMPYRRLLDLMQARLAATESGHRAGYADAAEFIDDLLLMDASLRANRGEHAGRFALERLLWRARTFGFHLATLDLRQDSAVHDEVLGRIDGDDWAARTVEDRVTRLHAMLDAPPKPGDAASHEAVASTLDVFRAVVDLRRSHGREATGLYIISMARSAADALAVLALARIAGCVDDGEVPLDVAPLFETVDDLQAAPAVMRQLFDDPRYRRHLAARGDRQTVMLGYSDSAKDGGLLASRWALQRTQVELTALAQAAGVRIMFFHGRGGSVSRGGGKTERAVIAAPRGSVDGSLRVTEQGEVIHRKYGIRALALRNLEQSTAAVVRATLRPRPADPREDAWRDIATALAGVSRAHYRALVHERADFPDYFRTVTPIDVIERLQIGSRPSRRRDGGIDNLRAIPWVFAWAQNRSGLTGWYGIGTALQHGIQAWGQQAMTEMARDWPFFRAVLDDVEMLLAKTDIAIFERYSQLAGDAHAAFFPGILDECLRTRDAILLLKEQDVLLADDYRLQLSIRLRNPYVDPISLLQVELLRRWRDGGREDEQLLRALVSTVNGIAAGIQNTG
ncbi:phosphoenolpyruvate carboxylase [Luteimonas sp. BDR2-5]|uniref:phosphoenolpyruvate carboxylase n=1 Tax=Proluteimonas luteida TaxID=2878685 RepID=UPI001E3DBFEB|nr:phosphoenolpyruvate carboxylase [Luteimonas sp. BDR2-5]MCD9029166.1 phosphoenolpyruvate carboxylase [Luteimonas sp. BDR2-5]